MNTKMQSQLNEYVKLEGKEELFNDVKLKAYFQDPKYSSTLHRLMLVLSCDTMKDFILHADKSNSGRVELNNLIMSVVAITGLKDSIAKEIISMICSSINISFNHELITAYDPLNNTTIPVENTLEPAIIQKKLNEAQTQQNEKKYDKAAEIYEELVKVGSRAAMYQLGKMYIDEYKNSHQEEGLIKFGKSEQLTKGVKLLELAASNGHTKARVELGNYYYFYDKHPESLKKAYSLYSSPGIPSTNQNVKDRLVRILNQEKTNLLVTILGGIWTAIIWVFLFVCGHSVHHDSVLIGWGLVFTIIPTLIYGVMCYSLVKYKYAYNKICMFAMMIIWFVYPLILAIN